MKNIKFLSKFISLWIIASFIATGNVYPAEETLRVPIGLKWPTEVDTKIRNYISLLNSDKIHEVTQAVKNLAKEEKKIVNDPRIQETLKNSMAYKDFYMSEGETRKRGKAFYMPMADGEGVLPLETLRGIYGLVINKDDSFMVHYFLKKTRLLCHYVKQDTPLQYDLQYSLHEPVEDLIKLLPNLDAIDALEYIKDNMEGRGELSALRSAKTVVTYDEPPGDMNREEKVNVRDMIKKALGRQEIKILRDSINPSNSTTCLSSTEGEKNEMHRLLLKAYLGSLYEKKDILSVFIAVKKGEISRETVETILKANKIEITNEINKLLDKLCKAAVFPGSMRATQGCL